MRFGQKSCFVSMFRGKVRSCGDRSPSARRRPCRAADVALAAAAVLASAFALSPITTAAEIQIRKQCRCEGGIVTLGDVAQIDALTPREADLLAAVELAPAPPPGQPRFLRAREIQDLLLLGGINLADHCFSGFSRVAIHSADSPKVDPQQPPSATITKRAERLVRDAVRQHLQQAPGANGVGEIELTIDDDQAKRIDDAGGVSSVHGGAAPWAGRHVLQIGLGGSGGSGSFPLEVWIRPLKAVVVAAGSIPRGSIIGATDVELRGDLDEQSRQEGCFYSVDQVVGSEATQAIDQGSVLRSRMVRTPLLVRQGEIVTVYARAHGVRVHTTARARDKGSLGEMIEVETLADRKVFFARVSGIRELEVDVTNARRKPGQNDVTGM